MTTTTPVQERIDLRTSAEVKDLIVRAAGTAGMSLSAFLLGAAQEQARRVLAANENLALGPRDWEAFARALDDTEKPRPKLAAAMDALRAWEQGRQ